MGRTFRQSMAWLHAWSGLVVGWVLFAVFVTGTGELLSHRNLPMDAARTSVWPVLQPG